MNNRAPYRLSAAITVVVIGELLIGLVLLLGWYLLLRDVPAFRFERPEMLKALLIGPLLGFIFLLHLAWRNNALARFASFNTLAHAVPGISTTRMLLQFLLLRHGLGFVILSLAGPQFGTRLEEVRSEGVDVMVAVDVSNSMAAEDLRPSRMELARRGLSQLIDRLQGDRMGIIVFAGEAFVQLPITTDRSAAKLFLASVNTDAVGTQGTAIGAAIDLAMESFNMKEAGSRAIIVITDGENHEDDAEGSAREAAKAGIVVHTIGMGTPQGGPIPIKKNGRMAGFKKDGNGNTVV
nr:VWA domain-containing protein [Bacteroidota bacterium]